MSHHLNLLILDDNPYDAEMELAILAEAGYSCEWERVDTRADFLARLTSNTYDIIIADHSLPTFDGLTALKLFKTFNLDTPFILVSGTVGEEVAIESLKAGAIDYVLKTRLSRLGPVVRRALLERETHRQRNQAEATRDRFAAILSATTDFVGFSDISGRVIYINQAMRKLRGLSEDENVTNTSISDYHPEWAAKIVLDEGLPAAVKDGMWKGASAFLTAAGQEIPVSQLILAHRNNDGEIDFISTMARDISDMKEAEEALRKSQAQLAGIIDSAMDAIIAIDDIHRIVLFNNTAEKMFRCPAHEALGQELDKFVPERFRLAHREGVRAFGQASVTRRSIGSLGAIYGLRADGEEFPIEASISQIEAQGRKFYTVILRDITERLRAEEALKESEEKFRIIFEKSLDVIAIIDIETERIVRVNQSARRLFGYEVEEMVGRNFSIIFPPESSHSAHELLQRLTVRDAVFESQIFARADGSACFMDLTATLIPWGRGQAVLATFRDVTERKRAEEEHLRLEEQLIQAQKMESIGRLAGGVAHDFNNLLTAIMGYSQLLLAQLQPGARFHRELEEIMKAGQRAGALTSQLLAFSRQQKLERKVININDTIGNLINMLRRIIGEDVEVVVQAGAALSPVYADPTQIEQVLLNLAVNARDAMPGGGKLTIRTDDVMMDETLCHHNSWAQPGRYAVMEVTDTGHGMDQETIQKIFDPFFTTKSVGKGTGLGLSVVYGIINQHDGLINVRSAPGLGTSFEIYLPIYQGFAARHSEQPLTSPRGGSETILVAEDEAALQRLISTLLSQLGYTVLMASDGEEAIRLYEENRDQIRVVVLDMVMPKMGGQEVYSKLRDLGSHLPVILMTGYTTEPAQDQASEGKGLRLLRKPYSINELAEKIREAMDSSTIGSRG